MCLRSTEPPLLPNPCYKLPFFRSWFVCPLCCCVRAVGKAYSFASIGLWAGLCCLQMCMTLAVALYFFRFSFKSFVEHYFHSSTSFSTPISKDSLSIVCVKICDFCAFLIISDSNKIHLLIRIFTCDIISSCSSKEGKGIGHNKI